MSVCVCLCHVPLNVDGASHRIHDARELHQHTIASGLHDASAVLTEFAVNKGPPMRPDPSERTLLVSAHQSAVTNHVGRKNCHLTICG